MGEIKWVYDRTFESIGGEVFLVNPRIYELARYIREKNRRILEERKLREASRGDEDKVIGTN